MKLAGGGGKNVSGDNQNEEGTNKNQKQKLGWVDAVGKSGICWGYMWKICGGQAKFMEQKWWNKLYLVHKLEQNNFLL